MKLILTTIVSILFIGFSYSQNCIESHTGKYSVNIDATVENLKKMSAEKGEEVTEDQIKMMTGMLGQIKLSITTDTLIMSMMGRDQKCHLKHVQTLMEVAVRWLWFYLQNNYLKDQQKFL